MNAQNVVLELLEGAGKLATKVASKVPGEYGSAVGMIGKLAKGVADQMRKSGDSTEVILARIKAPGEVKFDWEQTPPERPGAKKGDR